MFIDLERDWFSRTLVDQAFAAAHVARDLRCVVNDMWLLLNLVSESVGVAIVPAGATELVKGIAFVPFQPDLPRWEIIAAFRGSQPENPAARMLLGMVLAEFALLPQPSVDAKGS